MFAPRVEVRDIAPHEMLDVPTAGAPLWVAVTAGTTSLPDGTRAFDAMLLLGVPFDRFARSRRARPPRSSAPEAAPMIAERAAPTLKPPPRQPKAPPSEPASSELPGADAMVERGGTHAAEARPEPPVIPAVVTAEVARSAVRAALKHARLEDPDARIDAITSRARGSALLPEVRLRASRLVDEAQNLSPTEYDPSRITASGGTSVWLEARATWRLDRIVFADEEVALERMRYDRAEAQAKVTDKVLGLLFDWQRARAQEAVEDARPEARLLAALKALEAEAALDVLTDGWFTRWRARSGGDGA